MYHCHTEDSLLDSCTKFPEYADLALKNGQRAIASTEHGKPIGWVGKKLYCDSIGLRFIHGVEIYLTESLVGEKVRDNYHTVLLARNWDGVLELNRLVSKSCDKEHFYYTNRISFDEFLGISDNILSTSACLASPLNKLPETHPRYWELARKYDFLEVQPHNHPEQIAFNKRLLALSRKLGKPLIAGTDTHSSSAYKAVCREILRSSKRQSYADEDAFDLTYKTRDELAEMFRAQSALPEADYLAAIENTNRLYDLTEDFTLDRSIKYPILYGSREADDAKFTELIERKFQEKLASGVIPEAQRAAFRAAIDEELRVFRKLNMTGFMLSMTELICWCKSRGMAIGTARGSVGGSRVAYVTDIIDLNPETWRTVFSRFCNEDRVEIGDIDIDCVESDRPQIFQYITNRFGGDKTARVASFGTVKAKGAIDAIGRHLSITWEKDHPGGGQNPWSLKNIAEIKTRFDADVSALAEKLQMEKDEVYEKHFDQVAAVPTTKDCPELFYYFTGLFGVKISQSVHPAGMVISPIPLDDSYGVFEKDGENCLMLDMDEAHEVGLAKYDFLVLKTVQVIRDTCRYLNRPYPKTHEVDWDDPAVWDSMLTSPTGIFQFESAFAFDSLRKFAPKNIFDMSLVTASIRPTGASYRSELLARKPHHNPSPLIDDLLKENMGYLVYQEDTLKFLQQICGLSGSEADNIRRAIGRKQRDRLEKALPDILEGYCAKSSQPREVAEQEAKEFLKIIEDSASYQLNYSHSVAYCLLGYLCAYYRHYHPVEFLTAFLNNAANDADIKNGTAYAQKIGILITMPKWGASRGDYFFDAEKRVIAQGLSSIKYIGASVAEELYELSTRKRYQYFVDLLYDIDHETSLDTRQLDILIKLDFFSAFGNQRELRRLTDLFYERFKCGDAKKIQRSAVEGTPLEEIVERHAVGVTKSGGIAKSYTLLDVMEILRDCETAVKAAGLADLDDMRKIRNFCDAMGFGAYVSGKPEDRRRLYVTGVKPLRRKKDKKLFGYSVFTKSVGSGKESRFTVFHKLFEMQPLKEGDIIFCTGYQRDGPYFQLTGYDKIVF